MTRYDLINSGFSHQLSYTHDQYVTRRYQRGSLEINLTHEGTEQVSADLTIREINCVPLDLGTLKELVELFDSIDQNIEP